MMPAQVYFKVESKKGTSKSVPFGCTYLKNEISGRKLIDAYKLNLKLGCSVAVIATVNDTVIKPHCTVRIG